MSMKKLDWDRYVPLGIDGKSVRNKMAVGLGAVAGFSLSFLYRYGEARNNLFRYRGTERFLIEGAKIVPFRELRLGVFWAFPVMALALVFVAAGFYTYHSQDSRSIYTMKRLPNRWELWRRVLTLPVCAMILCGLTVLLLLGIYYAIYLFCTPAGCLP